MVVGEKFKRIDPVKPIYPKLSQTGQHATLKWRINPRIVTPKTQTVEKDHTISLGPRTGALDPTLGLVNFN